MNQFPQPGTHLLHWVGDVLHLRVEMEADHPAGRMVFRSNIGRANVRRDELIRSVEHDDPVFGHDWSSIPLKERFPGIFEAEIPLLEVGIFSGKACFLPADGKGPIWPQGENIRLKVAPAHTLAGNMIYAAFVRQFREGYEATTSSHAHDAAEHQLDQAGYTVIPPSGTFRRLIRELDHILNDMGFRSILLLPIHPTPTTFARMGRFGSPFAGRDFLSIDPALAEFDRKATPLDQFHELLGAVHARGATLLMDLPANHTGWAATFQIHHPEWYKRDPDGAFHSPGAWGTTWDDLVELDFSNEKLWRAVADVFLYWCRQGVDGFRCDAGYMIPAPVWNYVVANVRREFPDTIFFLEGLGGPMETTEHLIGVSHLDWAYSEVFQTYDRKAFEWMMPKMLQLSETRGPLVHFAETHDNLRLAQKGPCYAKLRVALSALLSQQGCFGITAGVEWLATERIDVHGCAPLNWGSAENLVPFIQRLNTILRCHPAFGPQTHLRLLQKDDGNVLVVLRETPNAKDNLLILINLDTNQRQDAHFNQAEIFFTQCFDLLTSNPIELRPGHSITLNPGQTLCLSTHAEDLQLIDQCVAQRHGIIPVQNRKERARRVMAMRICQWLDYPVPTDHLVELSHRFAENPRSFCRDPKTGIMRMVHFGLPEDLSRQIMVVPGSLLMVTCATEFRALLSQKDGTVRFVGRAVLFFDGTYGIFFPVHLPGATEKSEVLDLSFEIYGTTTIHREYTSVIALCDGSDSCQVQTTYAGSQIRANRSLRTLLVNGTGAMAQMRLAWGDIRSQYDCILGMNRHPAVPVDHHIFFTRCRAWVLYNGYSTPIDADSLESFTADPAGEVAEWRFAVPCGVGRRVPITIRVALEPLKNRAVIRFTRELGKTYKAPKDTVTLILRPDIEWRNFHCKTKAFAGPEQQWGDCITSFADRFLFSPEPSAHVEMSLAGGHWHAEGQWQYMIPHPEEAARGQEGHSDLYSPGWFGIDLESKQSATLIAGEALPEVPVIPALDKALDTESIPILKAMEQALTTFIVRRDAHKTVIAGYPWFLDWGRDTLIVLRGILAAGQKDIVYDVMNEFGRFEKKGTLPNMIRGEDDANRETVDAPLWFGAVVADLIAIDGAKTVLAHRCGDRTIRELLVSIATNYIAGTDNGIRVDPESQLVYSPSHYTWMDTNYPAGTPREGYAVEIQALWIKLLDLLSTTVGAKWQPIAEQARQSFITYFRLPEGGGLSDCLRASHEQPASQAVRDDAVRPNQLYAVTFGLLQDHPDLICEILDATGELLTPGSMRSLANKPVKVPLEIWRDGQLLGDPYHPYRGRYEGDEDTQRKPAYHNGTGWTFTFPLYAEALIQTYGPAATPLARSLLMSSAYLINTDCVTQIPECTQGNSPHEACGTGAQAWGVSELVRVLHLLKP